MSIKAAENKTSSYANFVFGSDLPLSQGGLK